MVVLAVLGMPAVFAAGHGRLAALSDSVVHLVRIGRLSDLVGAGSFLPRWTPELQLGLGYPVFSYYAPASYYLVALLHGVGLPFYLPSRGALWGWRSSGRRACCCGRGALRRGAAVARAGRRRSRILFALSAHQCLHPGDRRSGRWRCCRGSSGARACCVA
ncbi:MAG: hypothetical protein R2854_20965 [Caldilineaceae bacterium]